MRIPKIYLETSVFNFVFADDAPERRDNTIKLFNEIRGGLYRPFTSVYVTEEINNASAEIKEKIFKYMSNYDIKNLHKTNEIEHLADEYVMEGIIPLKYRTDALHIAAATVNELDIIVSWNFEHIVKRKTNIMTEVVNLHNGYKKIEIYSPEEVINGV